MAKPKVPEHLVGRHAAVYQEKLDIMHEGPCSSPRKLANTCPCPDECPLHGRCCDCIRHHLQHQKGKETIDSTYKWIPYCLKTAYTEDIPEPSIH